MTDLILNILAYLFVGALLFVGWVTATAGVHYAGRGNGWGIVLLLVTFGLAFGIVFLALGVP